MRVISSVMDGVGQGRRKTSVGGQLLRKGARTRNGYHQLFCTRRGLYKKISCSAWVADLTTSAVLHT
jgi:hypothetical protein